MMERRYQVSPKKVCAFTFISEDELPGDQKLVQCGQCKETHYLNRDAQEKHWDIHKLVCRPIEDEEAVVRGSHGFNDYFACLKALGWMLEDPLKRIKGRFFLYALQQYRSYLMDTDICETLGRGPVTDAAADLVLRPFFELADSDAGRQIFELLWAIPGFASYFMAEDVFISPRMKYLKENNFPPPEEERFLKHRVIDPETMHPISYHLEVPYFRFIDELFQGTIVSCAVCPGCLIKNDTLESGKCQSNPALGAAMSKAMMRAWIDPYARASIPSLVLAPDDDSRCFTRSEMFSQMFLESIEQKQHMKHGFKSFPEEKKKELAIIPTSWMQKNEVLPGMTAKNLLRLLLEDKTIFLTMAEDHAFDFLMAILQNHDHDQHCLGETETPWNHKYIDPLERVELLDMLYRNYQTDPILCNLEVGNHNSDMSLHVTSRLLYLVSGGNSTRAVLNMRNVIDKSMPFTVDKRTVSVIERALKVDMERTVSLVLVYLGEIEKKFGQAAFQDMDAPTPKSFLPEELIDTIAQYALPSKSSLIVSKKKSKKIKRTSNKRISDNMPRLRFQVGSKVSCRIGEDPVTGWAPGTIVELWYREPGWPARASPAPYKIKLDDGRHIFAPADVGEVIRSL
jgi:hypothetical protein